MPLVLRYLQGMSYAEAGEILSLSSDAVRMRIGSALKKLKKLLGRRGLLISIIALEAGLRSVPAKAASASFLASASSLIKAASGAGVTAKAAATAAAAAKAAVPRATSAQTATAKNATTKRQQATAAKKKADDLADADRPGVRWSALREPARQLADGHSDHESERDSGQAHQEKHQTPAEVLPDVATGHEGKKKPNYTALAWSALSILPKEAKN